VRFTNRQKKRLGFGGLYALLAAYAWRVATRSGGTLKVALATSVGLLVWIWGSLQLLVTGARAASTAAPPWLRGLFAALLALQFEGVTVNPSCFDYVPFVTQWIILGAALACAALLTLYALQFACCGASGCGGAFLRARSGTASIGCSPVTVCRSSSGAAGGSPGCRSSRAKRSRNGNMVVFGGKKYTI
jgi:hypothetical protein